MPSSLAISWEDHVRTRDICKCLGIPLFTIEMDAISVVRYPVLALKTIYKIFRSKPRVLFVQNPSLILALLTVLSGKLFRYKLLIDAHNEAVEPYINKSSKLLCWISEFVLRSADYTIVTNSELAKVVTIKGGRPLVLPNTMPSPSSKGKELESLIPFVVTVVASYAEDEPIYEIIEASRELFNDSVHINFTGNFKKLDSDIRARALENVTFKGFMPEDEYWKVLSESHVIIDLSWMDNCLVCGAYEALALHKPMMLTESVAIKEWFPKGGVFVDNSTSSIVEGIRKLKANYQNYVSQIKELELEFYPRLQNAIQEVRNVLHD